ncbi:VanZ family protein [Halorussus ruber]|uniref:VanZ family protein n=1 Tax=Halorussus ruber TaxID=1126238 RepID=UPI001092541B|nr:VanZ family protein [Halorussus ruber]
MNDDGFRLPPWLRWSAVAFVAAGILYASLLDSPSSAGLSPMGPFGVLGMDKWLHAVAYAALAGTLATALAPGRSLAVAAALAVLLAVGYGVGMEFAQASIPARGFSVGDIVANVVGAFLAVLVWRLGIEFVGRAESEKRPESEV